MSENKAKDPNHQAAEKYYFDLDAEMVTDNPKKEKHSPPFKPKTGFKKITCVAETRVRSKEARDRSVLGLFGLCRAQGTAIETGSRVSRNFTLDGIEMVLENGCSGDIYKTKLITLADATCGQEVFEITEFGVSEIRKRFPENSA